MARDYKKEYAEYQGRPEQIKHRAERNKARREMEQAGRVHKGDGMEVDHRNPIRNGGSNAPSNWRVVTRARNRGWADGKV